MLNQPLTSFFGFSDSVGRHHLPIHFASMTHWIEYNKFDRSLHFDVLSELLLMPSAAAVRSFSRQHQELWRSDWPLIRPSAISLGVAYHQLTSHYGGKLSDLIKREIAKEMPSESMVETLYMAGIELSLAPKVSVLADESVPVFDLNKKLRSLGKKLGSKFVLYFWRGRYSSNLVHTWAVGSAVPILYKAELGARVRGPQAALLLDGPDHYLIFEKRGDKRLDRLVGTLKSADKSYEVVYWQDDGQNGDLFQ